MQAMLPFFRRKLSNSTSPIAASGPHPLVPGAVSDAAGAVSDASGGVFHASGGGRLDEVVPPRRTVPALLMSLCLHVALLTTIGLVWSRTSRGTGQIEDRPIGIAIVHRLPDRDRYDEVRPTNDVAATEADSADSSSASPAAPPADLSPPLDLAGVLKSMQAAPTPTSGTGLAGDSKLDGNAFDRGQGRTSSSGTADTTAMLFGVSGSGSSFVYVFDRSDSMNGYDGRPLRAAKAELTRSLKTLTDRQQFQIVFYNDQPKPFTLAGLPLSMVSGDDSHLQLAESYIRSIRAFGGTEHESALKMALRMGPDVIFFLTDARIPRLSEVEMREIKTRADSVGTTIHCIEFGSEPMAPSDSFLRELAVQNHGQYRYINVQSLSPVSITADEPREPSSDASEP
jgi:hypothetical protein